MQNALAGRRARMCPHMSPSLSLFNRPDFRAYMSKRLFARREDSCGTSALLRLFGDLRKGRVF